MAHTMARRAWMGTAAMTIAIACQIAIGCGTTGDSTFKNDDGDAGQSSSGNNPQLPPGFPTQDGSATSLYTSLVITPQDPVVTVDVNGKTPTIDFSAKGILPDGKEVALTTGTWNFTRIDAAAFDNNGAKLVPTGFVGAKGEVSFRFLNQVATTSATVRLRIATGTPPSAAVQNAFQGATVTDSAMSLLYPYDGTVFPRGLPTPVMQWNGGGAADIYKIEAKSDAFEFLGWTTAAPPSRYPFPTLPADVWAKLTDSTVGKITVSVQRSDGVTAYLAKTQTWTIAPANLNGTIYYTRLLTGSTFVRRIQPGKSAESFLNPNPALPAPTCVACHSLSRDGSRMVASINGGRSPWIVFDTASGNELYRSNENSGFQAISPDGAFVLWRHWNDGNFRSEGELRLSAYNSDAVLAKLTPGVGYPGHPVWSPDGKRLAFSMRTQNEGLNFTNSNLWTTDVDLAASPPTFKNIKKIVDPQAPYTVATYPSFTPDSAWIAFMNADHSKTDGNHKGELWIANADGTTLVRLDRTNGVPDVSATPNTSWGPSFHPIAAGGYFWLAFFSERPYGNTLNGTNRQIWLAAVDGAPKAGVDPSHPGIYITGQDDDSTNERPQFTVNPCKPLGQSCENGYDCCDGYCRAGGDGGLVCQLKGNVCGQSGDKCATSADCCTGLQCTGGFCSAPPPK